MNKKQVVIIAAALILIIAAAVIINEEFTFGTESPYTKDIAYDYLSTGSRSGGYELSAASVDEAGKGDAISLERKIISTAHINIEVGNVPATINRITNITLQNGGFISGSSISGYEDGKTGQVTLRVPSASFYAAIGQIETLGIVKSKQVQGQDVTEEYIDVSARLGNLQKQENRLSEILKMANTVKDVLEVEKELERVRGEIERLTGRKNYLDQSIEMSTITVSASEPAPFIGDLGIKNAFKDAVNGFFETINGLIVFTGYIIPIAIYLIVAIFIGLGIKRKVMPVLFGKQ